MNLLIITKQRCWCLPVRGEIVVRAHSIMSEETLCSVFSGFYKKKDTSQSWELKEHFSIISASPTCIQTLSCKRLSTHNNLCADTCQCDQSHACLCTVPYAHKHLLWMQDLFTKTSKPHQVIKFHQASKAVPKRSIDAGKATHTPCPKAAARFLPLFCLATSTLHASAWRDAVPTEEMVIVLVSLPSHPVVTELSRCTGIMRKESWEPRETSVTLIY